MNIIDAMLALRGSFTAHSTGQFDNNSNKTNQDCIV